MLRSSTKCWELRNFTVAMLRGAWDTPMASAGPRQPCLPYQALASSQPAPLGPCGQQHGPRRTLEHGGNCLFAQTISVAKGGGRGRLDSCGKVILVNAGEKLADSTVHDVLRRTAVDGEQGIAARRCFNKMGGKVKCKARTRFQCGAVIRATEHPNVQWKRRTDRGEGGRKRSRRPFKAR